MSEWVNVNDKLPENNTICLVCGKKGGMRVVRATVMSQKSYWWTIVGTGKPFKAEFWMLLPKLPDGVVNG